MRSVQVLRDSSSMSFGSTLKALYIGEGVGRVLMNREIARSVRLSGIVLDVGGKGQPSYLRSLKELGHCQFIALDIAPDRTVNTVGSVERLPFVSNSMNCILCFNVLEHIFDYTSALSEIRRTLKPGGTLYGRVPFLFGIHADPHDYWRYTNETLERILSMAGFTEMSIEAQGGLFLAVFNLIGPTLRIGVVRVIGAAVAVAMDFSLSMILGNRRNRERYPMGYSFTAR